MNRVESLRAAFSQDGARDRLPERLNADLGIISELRIISERHAGRNLADDAQNVGFALMVLNSPLLGGTDGPQPDVRGSFGSCA
ncbi:MAG TPA: hypothetical protein H9755_10330 [Candidatus Dietzia intestinigallinarum]|nr:hypothetical protein [Candidatus Dietzia intestinigallinarum]